MRKKFLVYILTVSLASIAYACVNEPELLEESDFNEWLAGGSQTIFESGAGAFSSMFPNLSKRNQEIHEVGDAAFGATFVSAPSVIRPGLGPLFNNVSCTSCHINDGRGKPPAGTEQISSLLIRLSVPGQSEHGGPLPAPGFGGQLQQRSIFGALPETNVKITYEEKTYSFSDGASYSLQAPTYILENSYIPLPAGIMISPLIAPPVHGLGLLEAITEEDILARVDENDLDANGISGKANYVWDVVNQKKVIGRFGWKANNPNLLQQSAGAYNEDMGITNFVFPKESTYGQLQYDNRDDEYEVSDSLLQSVAHYIRTLAVPARRKADDPEVLRGKSLFNQVQCAACHIPRQTTKVNVAFPEISNQVIFPYTDLLVHDMGPGLADNRPDFDANGQEWRTSPLWGIGLTKVVNGHNNFLHDGRARNLTEAILWHGGEAEQSKESFRKMSRSERDALLKFLGSL